MWAYINHFGTVKEKLFNFCLFYFHSLINNYFFEAGFHCVARQALNLLSVGIKGTTTTRLRKTFFRMASSCVP